MRAYRFVQPLARGGTGVVWLADHPVHGRIAWKRVTSHEARAATAVAGPGLVRIVETGDRYLAMELAPGEPLDGRLRRVGRLGVGDALAIAREIARALGALHARDIVHCDVKPGNIIVGPETVSGRATLIDFGSAQLPDEPAPAPSGTPAYMAPEQAAGRVDARADVYALGGVVFAMLVGRPPFEGTRHDLLVSHAAEPAPPLSRFLVGVSPVLEAIVARCLAKDPAARFASGAELAAALDEISDHHVTALVAPNLPIAATTLSGSALAIETSQERRGVSPALVGLALVAASILAIVTGVRIADRRAAPPTSIAAAQPLTPIGACYPDRGP
jgi:eukaryotic-like serine/threonine-protein kinase